MATEELRRWLSVKQTVTTGGGVSEFVFETETFVTFDLFNKKKKIKTVTNDLLLSVLNVQGR